MIAKGSTGASHPAMTAARIITARRAMPTTRPGERGANDGLTIYLMAIRGSSDAHTASVAALKQTTLAEMRMNAAVTSG